VAVGTKFVDDRIIVEEAFAFGAPSVVLIAAVIANIDVVAVGVDS